MEVLVAMILCFCINVRCEIEYFFYQHQRTAKDVDFFTRSGQALQSFCSHLSVGLPSYDRRLTQYDWITEKNLDG